MDVDACSSRHSISDVSGSRMSTPRLSRAKSLSREGSVAASDRSVGSSSRSGKKRREIGQRAILAQRQDDQSDDDAEFQVPDNVSDEESRIRKPKRKRKVGKRHESWKRLATRWENGEEDSKQQRRPVFLESVVDTWLERVAQRTLTAKRLYLMARECGQVVCNYVCERLALTFEERHLDLSSSAFNGLKQHLIRIDTRRSDPNHFLTVSTKQERLAWSNRWRDFFVPWTARQATDDLRDPACTMWHCRRFVTGLRQAVLDQNWQFVGRQIGSFELNLLRARAPGADTARTYRNYRNQRYACIPYLPLIWRSGLQRIFEHRLDTDITAKLATEFLVTLLQVDTTNKSTQRHRVTAELCFVDLIVWLIAKEEYDVAVHAIDNAQQLSYWQTDRQYDCVLRFYKGLLLFLKWKRQGSANPHDGNAALTELLFAVEMLPDGQGFTGLEAAVQVLVAFERDEEVEEMCTKFCSRSPNLSATVAGVLRKHDLQLYADQLLDNAVRDQNEALSNSDPLWLDWAERRVRRPSDFGLADAVLAESCRVLVNFLDYGENATSFRAWQLLNHCLEDLSEEFSSVMRTLWSVRSDWWPSFHRSFNCSEEAMHMREAVLDKFLTLTDF